MSDTEDILEGFICPICKATFPDANKLCLHFEKEHTEQEDVLKSLFNLVGKAKNKILKLDETNIDSRPNYRVQTAQEFGSTRSKTDEFRTIRNKRLGNFAIETNKLILRLDKLLNRQKDRDKKQHAQELVPWIDGSSVTLCPSCARPFGVTRRQHHCRLCGSIICHSCSEFLSVPLAKEIIGSSMEVSHVVETGDDESIRLCGYCLQLLTKRLRLQKRRNFGSPFNDLYLVLRGCIDKGRPKIAQYHKMHNSLMKGETTYNLSDCQLLRANLAHSAEEIDAISRKILALSTHPREFKLINSIRVSTTIYLKEKVLQLPLLPTNEQLTELRRRPYDAVDDSISTQSLDESMDSLSMVDGWTATAPIVSNENADPLLVQINLIRGFIEQARKDLRFDEVALLENHLRELKNEYFFQQQKTHDVVVE